MGGSRRAKRLMGGPDFDVGSVRLLHLSQYLDHALGDHAIAFRVIPIDAQTTG